MVDLVEDVLNRSLPVAAWMAPHTLRLPGTVPIAPEDWLVRDEVFAARMAARDRLIAERAEVVHECLPGAEPAARELLSVVLERLRADAGYRVAADRVVRPDGVAVPLDGPPLLVAGRLVEEDLVILERPEGAGEHVLTGAILCFPSSWTLAQKIGRPLMAIHAPVARYDPAIGRRVQRLFDGLRPEVPLMRANVLPYDHGRLHNPRPEFEQHRPEGPARYLRAERQVLLRLPVSRAVVFSIHTFLIAPGGLPVEQRSRLEEVLPGMFRTEVAS